MAPAIRPPTRIAGTGRAERSAVTTVEEAFVGILSSLRNAL